MRNFFLPLAVAGAMFVPAAAQAQQRAVLVVDTDRILNECTACRAAGTAIQSQVTAGRTRAQQLQTQWQTEETALQTAVNALAGKQPDAALRQRIERYQTSRQQGQAELAQKESQIQSIQAHVQQQIGRKVVEIAEQIRARRQATVVISKGSLMAAEAASEVTAEVLTALNQQLPSVSVTPLPQAAARPQGR